MACPARTSLPANAFHSRRRVSVQDMEKAVETIVQLAMNMGGKGVDQKYSFPKALKFKTYRIVGLQIDKTTQDFGRRLLFPDCRADELKPHSEPGASPKTSTILIINESYYPVLQALRNGTYQVPLWLNSGFMVSFLGIPSEVSPTRSKRK